MTNKDKALLLASYLRASFLGVLYLIYLAYLSSKKPKEPKNKENDEQEAANGRLIWKGAFVGSIAWCAAIVVLVVGGTANWVGIFLFCYIMHVAVIVFLTTYFHYKK